MKMFYNLFSGKDHQQNGSTKMIMSMSNGTNGNGITNGNGVHGLVYF